MPINSNGKRIYFGKNTPRSFEENLPFSLDTPYMVRYKDFLAEDIAPLHYGTAMEIDAFTNVSGTVIYNKESIDFEGDIVLVFPPGMVHSITIHRGSGYGYVLQVSLSELEKSINLVSLFEQAGKSIYEIFGKVDCFNKIEQLINELVASDEFPISRNRALLEIFEFLFDNFSSVILNDDKITNSGNEDLLKIIAWTQQNYASEISLAEVASQICLSENYFCAWFKKNTSMTYKQYLNSVRINAACKYLILGKSVQESGYSSGFSDIPYFVQLFKKHMGCTPRNYREQLSNRAK